MRRVPIKPPNNISQPGFFMCNSTNPCLQSFGCSIARHVSYCIACRDEWGIWKYHGKSRSCFFIAILSAPVERESRIHSILHVTTALQSYLESYVPFFSQQLQPPLAYRPPFIRSRGLSFRPCHARPRQDSEWVFTAGLSGLSSQLRCSQRFLLHPLIVAEIITSTLPPAFASTHSMFMFNNRHYDGN